MDEILGSAWVEINSNIKELQRDIAGIKKHVDDSAKHMETRFNSATKAITLMGSAIAGIGVAKLGADIYGASIKMDTMNRMLVNIEGSQEKANKRFEQFRILAKEPVLDPFNLSRFYVGLKSVNVEADLSIRFMKSLANSMAGVGAGNEEFARSMEQFVQMMGKGKLVGQDLRVIAESFPQIRKFISEAFGGITDPEELAKKGFTAIEVLTRLNEVMEKQPKFAGGAQAALDNFKQSLQLFEGALGKDVLPSISKFLDYLTKLMDAFSAMPEATKKVIGTSVVGGLGLLGIAAALSSIISLIGLTKEGLVALGAVKIGANVAGAVAGGVASKTPALSALMKSSGEAGTTIAGASAGVGIGSALGKAVLPITALIVSGATLNWAVEKIAISATSATLITQGVKEAQQGIENKYKELGDALYKELDKGISPLTKLSDIKAFQTQEFLKQFQSPFLYGGQPSGTIQANKMGDMTIQEFMTYVIGEGVTPGIKTKLPPKLSYELPLPPTKEEKDAIKKQKEDLLSRYGLNVGFNEPTGLAGMGIESMYGGLKERPVNYPKAIGRAGWNTETPNMYFGTGINFEAGNRIPVSTTYTPQIEAPEQALGAMGRRGMQLSGLGFGQQVSDQLQAESKAIAKIDKERETSFDKIAYLAGVAPLKLKPLELAIKKQSVFWKDMGDLAKWTMDGVVSKSIDDMFNHFTTKQVTAGSLYNNWIGNMGISWEDWSRDFKKLEDDKYDSAIDAWNGYGYQMGLNYDDFETAWEATNTSIWDTWKTFLTDMLKEWAITIAKMEIGNLAKDIYKAFGGGGEGGGSQIGKGVSAVAGLFGKGNSAEVVGEQFAGGAEKSYNAGGGGMGLGTLGKVGLGVGTVAGLASGYMQVKASAKEHQTYEAQLQESVNYGNMSELEASYRHLLETPPFTYESLKPMRDQLNAEAGYQKFALGGIVTRPTMAMLGDNPSHREAVIPLDSPTGKQMLSGASGGVTIENINLAISLPNATLDSVDQNQVDRFFNQKLLPSLKRAVAGGALS
jgi:tape measure domain-containing protein